MKILNSKGFTILELLITIFVLSIGIVGFLQAFPLGTHIAKTSQMTTIATQLAQAKMEEQIPKSYDEISIGIIESKHQLASPFESYQRETKVSCVDPELELSEVVNCSPDPGIKKIEVTVFWKSSLGVTEKNIRIASLISKR